MCPWRVGTQIAVVGLCDAGAMSADFHRHFHDGNELYKLSHKGLNIHFAPLSSSLPYLHCSNAIFPLSFKNRGFQMVNFDEHVSFTGGLAVVQAGANHDNRRLVSTKTREWI